MNKIACIPFAIVIAVSAALAEEATNAVAATTAAASMELQDAGTSPWRISVGARFAPGVKTRAVTSQRAYSTLSGKMSFSGLDSRSTRTSASVRNSSSSLTETRPAAAKDGRYEFDAGFIDMNDSAGVAGETWNWHLDSSATFDESTGAFTIPAGSSSPSSSSVRNSSRLRSSEASGVSSTTDSVDDDLWGADVEIGYDFFRSDRCTVGFGFGVSFYEDADAFRLSGRCRDSGQERTLSQVSVDTSSEITENAKLADPYYIGEGAAAELTNDDGSYGAGTYDGYGNPYGGNNPVLSVSGIDIEKNTVTDTRTTTRTATTKSSLAVDLVSEGAVSTWDLRLALQPAFRATDWFELRGAFGVVMTHLDVDVDSTVFVNGGACRRISTSDDGFVFAGLCGLDAVFSPLDWLDVFVGADLRLGPRSWDFDTGLVRGAVELSRATCRAGVGIRF